MYMNTFISNSTYVWQKYKSVIDCNTFPSTDPHAIPLTIEVMDASLGERICNLLKWLSRTTTS